MKIAALIPWGAFAILSSCGGEQPKRLASPQPPPIAVKVTRVSLRELPATYQATGTVRARTSATVSSKIMGYVQHVSFQIGDRVRTGQLLITLDSRDLDVNSRREEAGRAEVQSAIPEADNAVAAAKANLDLAQATYGRMEDLAEKKSISNQEFDEASARRKSAQANLEMARARRAQLDSRMARTEQDVQAAGIMRGYSKIVAPFSGVVTARSVEPGNLAMPGAPLLVVEQDGVYRLEASVEESKIPHLRIGQTVEVTVDAINRNASARISEIVPYVDPASRTYTVKVDLPSIEQLRSGLFGRAAFSIGTRNALLIPASALIQRGQLQSVFVVEDGVAHTRLVTMGAGIKDGIEILSGLNPGDVVVAPVPTDLHDGSAVEVRQ